MPLHASEILAKLSHRFQFCATPRQQHRADSPKQSPRGRALFYGYSLFSKCGWLQAVSRSLCLLASASRQHQDDPEPHFLTFAATMLPSERFSLAQLRHQSLRTEAGSRAVGRFFLFCHKIALLRVSFSKIADFGKSSAGIALTSVRQTALIIPRGID